LLPAAWALAGCSGAAESGLAGIYRVTAQTRHQPCDSPGQAVMSINPPYFVVVDDALINGLYVNAYPCTGPDHASCDEEGFPLLFLGHKVGEGEYAAGTLNYDRSDAACDLLWLGARVKKTEAGVTLSKEQRAATRPPADCDGKGDSLLDMAHTFSCRSIEALVGTTTP
jgi:hypothetical protein